MLTFFKRMAHLFNSLKQKKLIVNFVVNRNWKKLTDSRKRAKILADNRRSYHPIETLKEVNEPTRGDRPISPSKPLSMSCMSKKALLFG